MEDMQTTRKRANTYFFSKVAFNAFLMIIGAVLITCKCSEHDIKGVIRYLNKALLQIFYRNDINVPFPNVTVSQLDMSDRKTVADLKDAESQADAQQR